MISIRVLRVTGARGDGFLVALSLPQAIEESEKGAKKRQTSDDGTCNDVSLAWIAVGGLGRLARGGTWRKHACRP